MPAGDAVVVHGGGPGASGDWALTVYDAVGSAPPRSLTPPLPVTRGGPAFSALTRRSRRWSARPTATGCCSDLAGPTKRQSLTVMDDDGGNAEVLVDAR